MHLASAQAELVDVVSGTAVPGAIAWFSRPELKTDGSNPV